MLGGDYVVAAGVGRGLVYIRLVGRRVGVAEPQVGHYIPAGGVAGRGGFGTDRAGAGELAVDIGHGDAIHLGGAIDELLLRRGGEARGGGGVLDFRDTMQGVVAVTGDVAGVVRALDHVAIGGATGCVGVESVAGGAVFGVALRGQPTQPVEPKAAALRRGPLRVLRDGGDLAQGIAGVFGPVAGLRRALGTGAAAVGGAGQLADGFQPVQPVPLPLLALGVPARRRRAEREQHVVFGVTVVAVAPVGVGDGERARQRVIGGGGHPAAGHVIERAGVGRADGHRTIHIVVRRLHDVVGGGGRSLPPLAEDGPPQAVGGGDGVGDRGAAVEGHGFLGAVGRGAAGVGHVGRAAVGVVYRTRPPVVGGVGVGKGCHLPIGVG